MNQYRVFISWLEPVCEDYLVDAENEEEAAELVLLQNDEIGEDYTVDRVMFMKEIVPPPEPPDPNQTVLPGVL